MRIAKVLNTNAVLAHNDSGTEVLVLGNGIGFKKKIGDVVEQDKIEKKFSITDQTHLSRFVELLEAIPKRYFIVAEEVIDYACAEYPDIQLKETVSLSLVDHIHNAINNFMQGIVIPNTMLTDIERFYPSEYSVGQFGLDIIYQNFGVRLPNDEAGFIAMHFVMAKQGTENQDIAKMLSIVHEVDELVRQNLNLQLDERSMAYFRYTTHLKFFAERVSKGYHYPETKDTNVLLALTEVYPKEYLCSKKVCAYVEEKYGYVAGADEEIYLMVHLAKLGNKEDTV